MAVLFSDTTPEAEHVLIELLPRTPVTRKLEMLGQMHAAARLLALQGLRARPLEWRRSCGAIWRICGSGRIWLPAPTVPDRRRFPMLPEPMAVTLQVIDALEEVGATYVVSDSLASTIHGVLRTALDTDIVADLRMR